MAARLKPEGLPDDARQMTLQGSGFYEEIILIANKKRRKEIFTTLLVKDHTLLIVKYCFVEIVLLGLRPSANLQQICFPSAP